MSSAELQLPSDPALVRARIYFTPCFSLLISHAGPTKGIIPGPGRRGAGMEAHRVSPRGRNRQAIPARNARLVVQEGLFFAIAAAASLLFLFHGMLYLDGRSPPAFRIEPFLFVTGLTYLFLRSVVLAIEIRWPRVHAERVQCPECGRWIDTPSRGVEGHGTRVPLPKAARRQGHPQTALRTAVGVAAIERRARDSNNAAEISTFRPEVENEWSGDLVAAPEDPDFLERARHGPFPPPDKRIRR
jgi:hypothetical protein